jgi:ornithine decarboxylase
MKNLFASNLDYKNLVKNYGSPLLVLDQSTIRFQYQELKKALPKVTLHYALKPLPLTTMVNTLNALGASFDLASNGEVDLVKSCGIRANKCIHTHPIKKDSDIKYALNYGCNIFVYDNLVELEKFKAYTGKVKLLLRVSFPNPETKVDLSKKFGCLTENVLPLLRQAKEWNIDLQGLSFHVGSQVPNSRRHVEAINACAELITQARNEGIYLKVLDIGGGFPVDYDNAATTNIYEFCSPIREALKQIPQDMQIIAEPGRFLSAPVMTNICTVTGKSERFGKTWYYLDDGIYCSYSGQLFDHVVYPKYAPCNNGPLTSCVLAGPTCDSIDVISDDILMPELNVGDIIVGKMMGAYTIATATEFNFIKKTQILVIDSEAQVEENYLKLKAVA